MKYNKAAFCVLSLFLTIFYPIQCANQDAYVKQFKQELKEYNLTLESFNKFFPNRPKSKKAFVFSGGLSEEQVKRRTVGGATFLSLENPPRIELDFSDKLSKDARLGCFLHELGHASDPFWTSKLSFFWESKRIFSALFKIFPSLLFVNIINRFEMKERIKPAARLETAFTLNTALSKSLVLLTVWAALGEALSNLRTELVADQAVVKFSQELGLPDSIIQSYQIWLNQRFIKGCFGDKVLCTGDESFSNAWNDLEANRKMSPEMYQIAKSNFWKMYARNLFQKLPRTTRYRILWNEIVNDQHPPTLLRTLLLDLEKNGAKGYKILKGAATGMLIGLPVVGLAYPAYKYLSMSTN